MADKRKRAIRERMERTGESYVAARAALLALWDSQDAQRPAGEPTPLAQDRPTEQDDEQDEPEDDGAPCCRAQVTQSDPTDHEPGCYREAST